MTKNIRFYEFTHLIFRVWQSENNITHHKHINTSEFLINRHITILECEILAVRRKRTWFKSMLYKEYKQTLPATLYAYREYLDLLEVRLWSKADRNKWIHKLEAVWKEKVLIDMDIDFNTMSNEGLYHLYFAL